MKNYLLVFFGGGIGAVGRYWLSGLVPRYLGSSFPFGILFVNIIGCFLIGFLMTFLEERFLINPSMRIFLTIGILGGFTTFSTFSYETFAMLHESEYLKAILYVTFSVVLGLLATIVGSISGKII